MKTSELIEALAAVDNNSITPVAPSLRLAPAALAGALVALAVLALWLGVQPLGQAARASWFWMKAGYSLTLAVGGFLLLVPLARPGARLGLAGGVISVIALLAIWTMAMHAIMRTNADHRAALWLGQTWRVCALRILALAAPIFIAIVLVLRRLAPTRLVLTGAAAGLLAGGLSAAVYGLYCQETAAPFVAVWYSLGVAGSAAVGALIGPRLLRW
ncbi:MAG: NrsF family protein [Caulobacteraceae bacterium]